MPIDDKLTFLPVNIAVLTVSDTRTAADDRSGDALAERIAAAGHRLADRAIERDDAAAIEASLRRWIADPASGAEIVGTPGGSFGVTTAGTLEMSNVDLAAEFTQMIVSQRGFQANSRVISTSDEMLQNLVNLKR